MSLSETITLAHRPLPPLSRMLVSLALTVTVWELRLRTRAALDKLSPDRLADIGCDPLTAKAEAAKPFWRA